MGQGSVTGKWKNNGFIAEDGLTERQRRFREEQEEQSRKLDQVHAETCEKQEHHHK